MIDKPHSPACERNRAPILDVLGVHFAGRERVLEIGSGSGQHAVYLAEHLPHLLWQASDAPAYLPGIRAWLDEAALPNTPAPIALQSVVGHGLHPLPDARFDAVFSANTLHIMGWPQVEALFAGLPGVLMPKGDARLAIYGPFNYRGDYTSASNREFDGWLKARDRASGIRDFEAVDALAAAQGFVLIDDIAMPANNRMLIWRRGE